MPEILQADELIVKAQQLKAEALNLINAPGGAENIERAEAMLKDAEALAAKSNQLTELRKRADGIAAPETRVPQSPSQKRWEGWGEYLLAVKGFGRGLLDPRLEVFEDEKIGSSDRKDLTSASGTAGGVLIPTEMRAQMMAQAEEASIVRSRAMVIPMSRRSIEVPALKQDGTTAGQPHWFGGMLAYWEAEAASMAETEPAFRTINLTAHELTAVTHASNNLLADSAVSLAALLTGPRGFPGVIAWKEDFAFLQGSGAGEPLGVLNAPATISTTRTTSNRIKYDDLALMMSKFLPSAKGVWVASLSLRSELLLMAGPAATNFAGTYLWGDTAKGIPDRLFGYPIIFTEKLPALGSTGDIMLCDFSHYYIGDRMATTLDTSTEARWLRNQTSWKVNHRVDGQPWLNLPFTLQDGSTTVSPFVKVAA